MSDDANNGVDGDIAVVAQSACTVRLGAGGAMMDDGVMASALAALQQASGLGFWLRSRGGGVVRRASRGGDALSFVWRAARASLARGGTLASARRSAGRR